MDAIAERAGVNKRLIYYYFEDKDELFLAVLEQTYADIRRPSSAAPRAADPLEAIRRLISFTWNYYLAHPEFLTLLNSENLHRAGHLKRRARIRADELAADRVLADVLERGRRRRFRGGIDPVQLYISIAGRYFYLSNNHTLSADLRARPAVAQGARERLSHMTDLVHGLRAAQLSLRELTRRFSHGHFPDDPDDRCGRPGVLPSPGHLRDRAPRLSAAEMDAVVRDIEQ